MFLNCNKSTVIFKNYILLYFINYNFFTQSKKCNVVKSLKAKKNKKKVTNLLPFYYYILFSFIKKKFQQSKHILQKDNIALSIVITNVN